MDKELILLIVCLILIAAFASLPAGPSPSLEVKTAVPKPQKEKSKKAKIKPIQEKTTGIAENLPTEPTFDDVSVFSIPKSSIMNPDLMFIHMNRDGSDVVDTFGPINLDPKEKNK